MKKYISVVIEYEEEQEQPGFHANMKCLGGKITGVMFDDALATLERCEIISVEPALSDYEEMKAKKEIEKEKYNELIMAVVQKFPNETRHDTALRYIKNHRISVGVSVKKID